MMNREILFRGKRANNGEWLYGYFERMNGYEFIANEKMRRVRERIAFGTVGRFTGLTDKNGRKIFEGDIVDYNGAKYEVVFETRCSAYFGIKISHIETWQFCLGVPAKLMEVIGNIHDNPELLKGETI